MKRIYIDHETVMKNNASIVMELSNDVQNLFLRSRLTVASSLSPTVFDLVFGEFGMAGAQAVASHLEAGQDHILPGDGDVSVAVGGTEVEDGVQRQLKLWTRPYK